MNNPTQNDSSTNENDDEEKTEGPDERLLNLINLEYEAKDLLKLESNPNEINSEKPTRKRRFTPAEKQRIYKMFVEADDLILDPLPGHFLELLKVALNIEENKKRSPVNFSSIERRRKAIKLEASHPPATSDEALSLLSDRDIAEEVWKGDSLARTNRWQTIRKWRSSSDYQHSVKFHRNIRLTREGWKEDQEKARKEKKLIPSEEILSIIKDIVKPDKPR